MIVIDASVMIEIPVGGDTSLALLGELTGGITAPHVLDLEVLSVLRGLTLAGKFAPEAADRALQEYFQLNVQRHSTALLTGRIWYLRCQSTAYDASYLILAEALGVPLITCDRKLAPLNHRAEVRLFPLWHRISDDHGWICHLPRIGSFHDSGCRHTGRSDNRAGVI